jgi:F420-dependent oxidoreductase-like protein
MRLGLHIGHWGGRIDAEQQLAAVRAAEELGYDSVWTAEAYGSDAATILAWLAAATSRIRLGTGILQMPARTPAMTAMTAATIDRLSGGRMILGLGSSGPQVAEGWHGQRFAGQLLRTREYFEVVRMALSRQRVEYHGETIQLPLPDGPGKALKLTISPAQRHIPLYLAAIGPRNTALAGEIADGWIPTFFAPEHIERFGELLAQGATRGQRSLDGFDIAPHVNVHIGDDLDAARDHMRPGLALYVGGMGSREQNFYKTLVSQYGFADAAQEIQDLYLAGHREEACRAIPDELIDQVSLCGPRELVAARLCAYRDAGVGTLIASPAASSVEEQIRQLRELAELAA